MGIELEFKLAVSSPELLEAILFDPQVKEVRRGDYQLYHMATIYYDTPDRRLGTLRWTLRLRQENNTLVATLKTPAQGNIRGEWSCQAANIREAVPVLLEAGVNQSLVHVDFMVGTRDLRIEGIRKDGSRAPVFEDGVWAF